MDTEINSYLFFLRIGCLCTLGDRSMRSCLIAFLHKFRRLGKAQKHIQFLVKEKGNHIGDTENSLLICL